MTATERKTAQTASGARLPPRARLAVNLGAIAANYREVLRRGSPAAVAPVVKANAYGLGMAPIARHLSAAGADTFFVARLDEGILLRRELPRARVFVLDGTSPECLSALVAHRLTPVLNAPEEIALWSAHAREQRVVLDAAIHIDTGMNRSGLGRAQTNALATHVKQALAGVNLALLMSHLACADEPAHPLNRKQLDNFRTALAMLPPAPASLAATSGVELGRDYLFDLARPGLGLYGGNPNPERPNPYRSVAHLTAPVLQVRHVEAGETVGYGATFTASRPTVLAIIAAGYADGLMRALAARGHAMVAGTRAAYAGRISMDLAALDVSHLSPDRIGVGAEVELLGEHVSLEDAAAAAGTINHEILTSLSPRAERTYFEAS